MGARFVNRTVLVTGGGSGLGRATALAYAAEGAAVVVAGRQAEPLRETVKLIEADGGRAIAVPTDVSDEAEVIALIEAATAEYGSLDVAFNNAGVARAGRIADLELDDWNAVLAANLTGVWLSLKHEIRYMREHGGGVIVNTSSTIGAHIRWPGMGVYGASKAAVTVLSGVAAKEYIRDGIRINTVSPGPLDTDMSKRAGETEADRASRVAKDVPIGRVGSLAEAAATVLWLSSPESGYAVGTDVVIDGGVTA